MNEMFVRCTLSAIAGAVLTILSVVGYITADKGNSDAAPNQPVEEILCPDGWKNTSDFDADHIQLSCTKGDFIVYLDKDKHFNYAWDKNHGGDFIFDSSKVPQWH